MESLFPFAPPLILLLATAVTFGAGLVKGLTGFGMPMIMISGLSLFLPPQIALAGLILPTLVTNGMQALRQGRLAARATTVRFRVFLLSGLVFLLASAQLVTRLDVSALYLLIGGPILVFTVLQLSGWRPRITGRTRWIEVAIGGFSGFVGGLSGVWGPPTVAYLTALDLPKADHVRAQGVIYALGAVALFGAHLQSGVVRGDTLPFSVLMIAPAVGGMLIGRAVQDRIDQRQFRRVVLLVLLIVGLNLIRRGLIG